MSEYAELRTPQASEVAEAIPKDEGVSADVRHAQVEAEAPAKQASGVEVRINIDSAAGKQQTRSVLYKVTEAGDGLHAAKTLPAANDSAITETKPAGSGELSQCMSFLQGMRHYEQTEGQQLVSDEPEAETGQHRITGELEQQHPEIVPLPPTPMTREASARLESWGVSPERIRDLRDLTSSMRYDLCPQKAERIAQTGGYLQETDEGMQEVVLPHFYDSTARLDGQCADIAIRYHELLHTSGYLKEVNQELADKGRPPLERAHIVGLSRTHFNQPGQTHIWTGLMPKGAGINELLTTDASFQEISMTANNGYTVAQLFHNPPKFSGVRSAKAFAVKSESNLSDFSHTAVLGMSSDRQLSFGLGFYRQESTGEVRPVINALPGYVNGPEDKAYCTLSNSGEVTFANGARLSGQQKREMHDIASGLHTLALIPDADKAEAARQHGITINLR